MGVYRAQFGRLLALDEKIRAGKHPNCTSFAADWEVSAKTVQRDIEFLRDSLGAPIEYDAAHHGYAYSDATWRLGPIDLSEGELLQLVVAERMASQFQGSPIAGHLDRLFEKLRAALPSETRIDPIDVRSRFSFHGHPVRPVSRTVWRTVARALRNHRVLRVAYRRYGDSSSKDRDLEPIHLASLDGEWILVARMRGHEELQLFALSRMARVVSTDKSSPQIEFDPAKFFENRFARFVGEVGVVYDVVVRFTPAAAAGVLERVWHPKQRVERRADGCVILQFPAPALHEVQRWVLQWGSEAEIVAPPELRTSVARESRRLGAIYRNIR